MMGALIHEKGHAEVVGSGGDGPLAGGADCCQQSNTIMV